MTQAKTTANPALTTDAVDPELVALPLPPRGRRIATMTVMALVVVLSTAFAISLRHDTGYFFSTSTPVDLGEAASLAPASLVSNTYARVRGTPMVAHTVRFQRMLGSESFAVFPLAGQRTIFVQVPLDDGLSERLARGEYVGRLVRFGDLGARASAVRSFLAQSMGLPVSAETYLLMADEPPGTYVWSLGLALLCAFFVLVNVWLFWRWFRPVGTKPV